MGKGKFLKELSSGGKRSATKDFTYSKSVVKPTPIDGGGMISRAKRMAGTRKTERFCEETHLVQDKRDKK